MSDFSFVQNNINQVQLPWADIALKDGDFLQDNFLETSMMVSLFSDGPVSTDELNRFNEDVLNKTRNRGWFGSSYANLEYGSKLWLLEREKRTDGTLNLAQQYCEESLQWIITEGIAREINVECSWYTDILVIVIEVVRAFDENIIKQYSYVWDNLLAPNDLSDYNVLWKRFDNNINVGIFSPINQPVDDVGYMCIDGSLVKAYNAGLTHKKPFNYPTFFRQCNDGVTTWPPTDKAHLVGMPYSDNFDGNNCDSGIIGDTNWLLRGWQDYSNNKGTSSVVISVNNLEHILQSNGPTTAYGNYILTIGHSGEFEIEIDCVSVGISVSKFLGYELRLFCGADQLSLAIEKTSSSNSYYWAGSEGQVLLPSVLYGPRILKITRQADNKIRFYVDDGLVGTSTGTVTDDLESIYIYSNSQEQTQQSFSYSYLSAIDGSGNPIHLNIEGLSC